MFLTNQNNKKSFNDYLQLVTKIRNEYNILAKENQALKSQLEQYKNYYDANITQRQKKPDVSHRKRKPNYKYSYHNDDHDDDEDDELKNNYYIPKRKNKRLKKKKSYIKILLMAMNHLHPLKMKKKLMMKLEKKMMMGFTKLEKLKGNSQKIQKQKL